MWKLVASAAPSTGGVVQGIVLTVGEAILSITIVYENTVKIGVVNINGIA